MRVLVIGGTNFIGPPVVAELHRLGCQITVFHRGVHEPPLPAAVQHVHSPLAHLPFQNFPAELTRPNPDVVLHMFPVGEADALAAMARFAGEARRIVGISSGDVYRAYGRLLGTEPGPAEPVPMAESAGLRSTFFPYRSSTTSPDDWTYHYEKILAERALMGDPSLPGTVLRLPAVYGPGDPYRRFRPYIKRMLDERPGILLGALHAEWRWTHGYIENAAHAIAIAVTDERAAGRVYNVGEERVPTTADRVRQIGQVAGWKGSVVPLPGNQVPQHLRMPFEPRQDIVVDTRRLRSELGFIEPISMEEGLRRTIAWEREHNPESGDPGPVEYAAEDAALR